MRRIALLALTLSSLIAAAAPAAAQQRLFAVGTNEVVEIGTAPASFGQPLRRTAVAPQGPTSPTVIAGGSALVWASNLVLKLYDTRSGQVQAPLVPGFAPVKVLGTDPSSYRVLVMGYLAPRHTGVLIADLRTGTMRKMDLGVDVLGVAYAPRSNALFVGYFQAGVLSMRVDVLDADSGALLHQLPAVESGVLSVDEFGTRLYLTEDRTVLYDVPSGALLGTANMRSTSEAIVDETRGRLLRSDSRDGKSAGLQAFSSETLAPIGVASLPAMHVPAPPLPPGPIYYQLNAAWDANPRSATIFALQNVWRTAQGPYVPTCGEAMLVALDAGTGSVRRTADAASVTGTTNCQISLIRVVEPAAPRAFTANVTGRRVSFAWGVEAATHYEIEAGATPGATNLTIPVTGPEFAIDGVPPGVYHVRVRAVNVIGKSAASQELRVVVE